MNNPGLSMQWLKPHKPSIDERRLSDDIQSENQRLTISAESNGSPQSVSRNTSNAAKSVSQSEMSENIINRILTQKGSVDIQQPPSELQVQSIEASPRIPQITAGEEDITTEGAIQPLIIQVTQLEPTRTHRNSHSPSDNTTNSPNNVDNDSNILTQESDSHHQFDAGDLMRDIAHPATKRVLAIFTLFISVTTLIFYKDGDCHKTAKIIRCMVTFGCFITEFMLLCWICVTEKKQMSLYHRIIWGMLEMIAYFLITVNVDPLPYVCGWTDDNTLIWEIAMRFFAAIYIMLYTLLSVKCN